MENLHISSNKKYLMKGDKPFFWLGDTAWMLFTNISYEEAYTYLKNRADKGFNVIQSVLIYSVDTTEALKTVNRMCCKNTAVDTDKYWHNIDMVIKLAEELGLYMALLPCWGSIVKENILNMENVLTYAKFLTDRYKDYSNIIWVLGGDVKAEAYKDIYTLMGTYFKEHMPDKLVTFHPFGRCSSTTWFADDDWLDFNMFQSGHRRYDQCSLGAWDDTGADNTSYYGEDNWKYVLHDRQLSDKPVLDGEPSYEWIIQGLHDNTEPYWRAKDVRRYAYWSVLAGACGHTYGDNAVMQFHKNGDDGVNYGVVCEWEEALHHEGSGEMLHLKKLMESVDFTSGKMADELLLSGQKEKYGRISVFAGSDYVIAYDYSCSEFTLDVSAYSGKSMYWMSPVTGVYSYIGKCVGDTFTARKPERYEEDNADRVLVIS